MGPNLLVWGTSFFTKAARDPRFISWHQDSTYYGLEPPESVTAWIAFSDSTEDSGCMRIIPGSHNGSHILPHVEKSEPDNLLSRGQTIEGIDGLRQYLLKDRHDDFVQQFCRKLLGYALGREVQLSDEPFLKKMRERLEKNGYRFSVAVEAIVTSEQFRNIRSFPAAKDN